MATNGRRRGETAAAETLRPATITIPVGWFRREFLGPLLAVLFNLVVLADQLRSVDPLNDTSVHLAVIRWARRQMDAGQFPIDSWFPQLQLGVAISRHYQAVPDLVTAALSGPLGVDATFHLLQYLLLATWPVSVYIGVRLLGWEPLVAGAAALCSPLVHSVTGYGFEHGSYTWQGSGLYTQLWGMWLLPLAYGLTWQAIDGGRRLALAALALALVLACHFLTAYQALATAAVWVLVDPRRLPARLLRFAIVGAVAALAASMILLPVFSSGTYSASSIFLRGTFWDDSWGASTVMGWLAGGQLLDAGRLPTLTVLGAIGLVICGARARSDRRARALLSALAISLFLFAGRPTFGPLINLLPGNGDLLLHRFVAGVHLAWIVLAGIGLAWVAEQVAGYLSTRPRMVAPVPAVAALVTVLALLAPAAVAVAQDDGRFAAMADQQVASRSGEAANFEALAAEALALGDGRLYAGDAADYGNSYRLGMIPANIALLNLDAPAIGFGLRVPALAGDAEAFFNSSVAAQYDLFNVRYVIAPSAQRLPAPARLLLRKGSTSLWQLPTSGYLEMVETAPPPLIANRFTLGSVDRKVLSDADYARGIYHQVAFAGAGAPEATLVAGQAPRGAPGSVLVQAADPENGAYSGQVHVDRDGVLILKATYDPGWQVLVDGVRVETSMVAPGYPAVHLGPGSHQVTFRYVGESYWPGLLLLGIAGLVALWRLEPRLALLLGPRTVDGPADTVGIAESAPAPRPKPRRRSRVPVPPA